MDEERASMLPMIAAGEIPQQRETLPVSGGSKTQVMGHCFTDTGTTLTPS